MRRMELSGSSRRSKAEPTIGRPFGPGGIRFPMMGMRVRALLFYVRGRILAHRPSICLERPFRRIGSIWICSIVTRALKIELARMRSVHEVTCHGPHGAIMRNSTQEGEPLGRDGNDPPHRDSQGRRLSVKAQPQRAGARLKTAAAKG